MAEAAVTESMTPDVERGLTRTVNLAQVSWATICWILIFAIGAGLRLFQIGANSLSPIEGLKAFDAWSLFYGATEGPYREPTTVEPAGLLARGFSFFLFGASDTTARVASALIGIGILVLIWSIRDLLGELRAIGAGALVALSPTLVLASRTVNEEIITAFFAFLLIVTVFRLGEAERNPRAGRAIVLGFALAGLLASGPAGVSVLIVLALTGIIALFVSIDRGATIRSAVSRVLGSRDLLVGFIASFVISTVALFTRFFSDPGAISGLGELFSDWGKLIATAPSQAPTQFFILSILLYDLMAVVFGVKAAIADARSEGSRRVFDWSYPAVWFLLSLVLFSFSSGRTPDQTVLVAFPLLLLGGMGLGDAIEKVVMSGDQRRRTVLYILAVIGAMIALLSTLVLIGRVDTARNRSDAIVQVITAAIVALGPLVIIAYTLGDQIGRKIGWGVIRSATLLGISVVITLLTIRSTVELSFYRLSFGTEMLGQNAAARDLADQAQRIANLSRDINGTERSPSNPVGGKEMTIRIDRTAQWPFRWYLRDFPNVEITAPGAAPAESVQLVIAPDPTGMTEAGYQPRTLDLSANPAPAYTNPSIATVLKYIFVPSNWDQGMRFLLYRDTTPSMPDTVVLGYASDVVSVMTGERPTYQLFDRAGAGVNPGQFNQPRGIAVSPDGVRVYVLDTQNNRIQVFDAETGELLGIWGDGEGDNISLALTDNGLGPYGIATGPDGLVYVADTWNHRVVVISPDGQELRTFGEFGNNEDSPDPTPNPGTFYGPRSIAIHGDEIFVSDTGNERIQVFGMDGSFRRAFGGTGSGAGQLLEPVGVAISEDGIVYVADSGNARISAFNLDGTPLIQWTVDSWVGQQFFEPYLAVAANGTVYASSPTTASVLAYTPAGELEGDFRDADGESMQMPAGLAFDPAGVLYIADRGSSEIYTIHLAPGDDVDVVELPGTTDGSPDASPAASPEGSPEASPAP